MTKTKAQKEKQKLKKKAAKIKAKVGKVALTEAVKAGYKEAARKAVGHGDIRVSMPRSQRFGMYGKGDLISDGVKMGAGLVEGGIRSGWNAIKSFFGSGDYTMGPQTRVNSFFVNGAPPVFGSKGTPGTMRTRVTHKEMIGTISSSAAFSLTSFTCNPGLSNTFPWLSNVASSFQRYRMEGGYLAYQPNIDAYGGANINGKVALAARYLISEPAPINMTEMENCQYSVAGRPGEGLAMCIECAPGMGVVNNLSVRSGSYTGGESLTFFDHCIFDIAVSGQADGTATLGSLYLIYDVSFEMPIDVAETGSLIQSDKFQCSAVDSSHPLGTTQTAVSKASLGGACTSTTYTFPSYINSGKWFITLFQVAATSVSAAPTITATSGCTKVSEFCDSTGFDTGSAAAAFQTAQAVACAVVNVTASSAVLTFGTTTISGTCKADIVITPIDADIITLSREKRMFSRQIKRDDAVARRTQELVDVGIREAMRRFINDYDRTMMCLSVREAEEKKQDRLLRDDPDGIVVDLPYSLNPPPAIQPPVLLAPSQVPQDNGSLNAREFAYLENKLGQLDPKLAAKVWAVLPSAH
jgi:hypothetical protein